MRSAQRVALVVIAVLLTATLASANMLVNPGFEDGFNGWTPFGNAYVEADNGDQFVAYEGMYLCSMFGNWSGPWNVTGIFQEFPAAEGDEFSLSAKSRHWGGDPMIGIGAPNDNWVVQKIAFFDAIGEIGAVESTILDGTFAPYVWHDNAAVVGTAPAGTIAVQALILYIQPADAGGAAHIDNVEFLLLDPNAVDESSWGVIKSLYR